MENKYTGTLLQLKELIPLDSKALALAPMEAALLEANPLRRGMQYQVLLQAAASFLK
jgi:hypothetical protein